MEKHTRIMNFGKIMETYPFCCQIFFLLFLFYFRLTNVSFPMKPFQKSENQEMLVILKSAKICGEQSTGKRFGRDIFLYARVFFMHFFPKAFLLVKENETHDPGLSLN